MRLLHSLYFFCVLLGLSACLHQTQKENTIPTTPSSDSEKAQYFYQHFQPDSALFYHEKRRKSLDKAPVKQQIESLILQTRLYRLTGKKENASKTTDTIAQKLQNFKEANPSLYAAWLNEKAENFVGINNDSASYFAKQAQLWIPKINELQNDYIIRNQRIEERVLLSQNKLDSVFSKLGKIQKLCEDKVTHNPYLSYLCYSDWGYAHIFTRNEYEAQRYYEKAYTILAQHFPHQTQRIADLGFYLADLYRRVGKYEAALKILQTSSEQFEGLKQVEKQSNCYHKMGLILYEQGETDLAIEHFQKALHLVPESPQKPYILNDIGLAYMGKKNYTESIKYAKQILPIYKEQQALFDEATAYFNLGLFYYMDTKYDSALYYFEHFPEIDKEEQGKWLHYQNLYMWGNALCKKNKLAESEQKLQKSLQIANELGENKSWQKSEIYMGLAEVYQAKKLLPAALSANQKALVSLLYQYEDSNFRQNPPLQAIVSSKYLLLSLRQKADLLKNLYGESKQIADLQLCLATQELAQNLIDSIRLDFQGNSSKLSLMGELLPLYESSIQTALQLHKLTKEQQYIEKAFLYAERNKATILYESLQSKKATQLAGVPDSLLRKVNDLQTEIGYLEHELYAYQGENRATMQDNVLNLREKYQKLTQQVEKDFPSYYQSRYQIDMPTIADFRKQLKQKEQGLVEFFVGDSTGYVFYMDEKNIDVQPFVINIALVQKIQDLRKQLSDRTFIDKPEEAYKIFTESAYSLYQTLLQPIDNQLKKEKLLIIPDGLLGYIPFEILLQKPTNTEKINYFSLPYLLRDFEISYAYSGTLWLNPLPASHAGTLSCVAFAPVFSGENQPKAQARDAQRQSLATLENTRSEVAEVGKRTHGDVFTDEAATESRFKAIAMKYRIIHLATHALINDENPLDLKLAFANETGENDGFLYVYELFGMRLNAEMAVLSACNTGNGKLQRGEGVMSLARGFAQAGVPAIVMSLWTAQDQSTSEIMAHFYEALAKGESKDKALREAKLYYLDNTKKLSSHPYFWAAFVLMGDTNAMQFPTYWGYYGLGGLLLLGGLGLWFWRRSRIFS